MQNGETRPIPPVKRSLDRIDGDRRGARRPIVARNAAGPGRAEPGLRRRRSARASRRSRRPCRSSRPAATRSAPRSRAARWRSATPRSASSTRRRPPRERARELAENGDLIAQLDALIAESIVHSAKGELERAVPLAQECVDRAEETGASACVVASAWILGDAFHRQGRFAEARDILQRGTDISHGRRPQGLATDAPGVARVDHRRRWARSATGPSTRRWRRLARSATRSARPGSSAKRAEAAAAPRRHRRRAFADFEASAAILEELGLAARAWLACCGPGARRCAPPGAPARPSRSSRRVARAVRGAGPRAPRPRAVRTELALGDVEDRLRLN